MLGVRIPPRAPIEENEVKFVIQQNLMGEQQLSKTRAAVEPYPHVYVGLIPFSHEITSNVPLEGTDFIPYGSTLMTNVTKELGWKGLHFDLAQFNYEASALNRTDMLNAQFIMTIDEAVRFMTNGMRGANQTWFVRPSEDLKQFAGQVMEAQECADWFKDAMACESSGSYKLEPDTKVVIAEPKNLQAEWRWFVVGGKVVSGSMYRREGQMYLQRETDEATIREAQMLADKWLPDPCCVMDLALVNNEVKVIEFNCINSSGFYDNDVVAVFKALYDYHT